MALSHNSLQNYFSTIFSLAQHHKYSLSEIENLIPFERDIYIELLMKHIKETEDAKQRLQNGN